MAQCSIDVLFGGAPTLGTPPPHSLLLSMVYIVLLLVFSFLWWSWNAIKRSFWAVSGAQRYEGGGGGMGWLRLQSATMGLDKTKLISYPIIVSTRRSSLVRHLAIHLSQRH
jgi:hypothetical protein